MTSATDRELLIRMDEKLDTLASKVETIEKRLFTGNGQPPLTQDIQELKDEVKGVKKTCGDCGFEKFKNKAMWSGLGLAAAIIVILVAEHAGPIASAFLGKK